MAHVRRTAGKMLGVESYQAIDNSISASMPASEIPAFPFVLTHSFAAQTQNLTSGNDHLGS